MKEAYTTWAAILKLTTPAMSTVLARTLSWWAPIKYPNHPQALVKLETITVIICHTQGMRARLHHLGRDAESWDS